MPLTERHVFVIDARVASTSTIVDPSVRQVVVGDAGAPISRYATRPHTYLTSSTRGIEVAVSHVEAAVAPPAVHEFSSPSQL
jgi:2-oxoglutarate dehydrogenase complex dehydrogenase (E1) component-like enzyme